MPSLPFEPGYVLNLVPSIAEESINNGLICAHGALAQLGERYPCKVDVVRSSRICSILHFNVTFLCLEQEVERY